MKPKLETILEYLVDPNPFTVFAYLLIGGTIGYILFGMLGAKP